MSLRERLKDYPPATTPLRGRVLCAVRELEAIPKLKPGPK